MSETVEDFRYTDEFEADGAHALIFRAGIGGTADDARVSRRGRSLA